MRHTSEMRKILISRSGNLVFAFSGSQIAADIAKRLADSADNSVGDVSAYLQSKSAEFHKSYDEEVRPHGPVIIVGVRNVSGDVPKLLEVSFYGQPILRPSHSRIVGGDAGNSAVFFVERYQGNWQERSVEELKLLATHTVLEGHSLNQTSVDGLDILLAVDGQEPRFMEESEKRDLESRSADIHKQLRNLLVIGPGDVTDDDILDSMGDPAIGTITSHNYSAAHPSAENKAYIAAFEKANPGMRPNFMAIGGYDGMALIYEVLKKTGGSADGDKFVAAAKGLKWMSPRGPVMIDPQTRDIVQDVYFREVKRVNGHLWNVEFDRVMRYRRRHIK